MREWNYQYNVPDQKKIRMIVDTDCKNEADDQFALAHHLMTPKFIVRGIIGAHFNLNPQEWGQGHTAEASVAEIHKVMQLMDVDDMYQVYRGSEYPLEDEMTSRESEGADFIITEAMRDDPHPLYIAVQGAVTDLAIAIMKEPRICDRMTAIWIGGGMYPEGGFEFNLLQDIPAANILMKSTMPVWQVPIMTYKQMAVSLSELQLNVAPCGQIGQYLFDQMVAFNNKCASVTNWPHGEIWGLGDSPTVGLLLEEAEKTDLYEMREAPEIDKEMKYHFTGNNRQIRVYKDVNARLTLSDFFAKLRINYGQ